MNQGDLYQALLDTGYPVAYREFKQAPRLPYVCYLLTSSADFIADDQNYHPLSDFDIELYSEEKDQDAEAAVEDALRVTGLVWSKSETYIEIESMHQVTYSVRI